eukprot:351144-Chlamydomonas_euryale.AAC.6
MPSAPRTLNHAQANEKCGCSKCMDDGWVGTWTTTYPPPVEGAGTAQHNAHGLHQVHPLLGRPCYTSQEAWVT